MCNAQRSYIYFNYSDYVFKNMLMLLNFRIIRLFFQIYILDPIIDIF